MIATFAHTIYVGLFVVVVVAIVVADNFLPDSAEEELRRWYRGQRKRRERRGSTD